MMLCDEPMIVSLVMNSIHLLMLFRSGQLLGLNPQLRSMLDSNSQIRELMQNPEFLRQMASPETMQVDLLLDINRSINISGNLFRGQFVFRCHLSNDIALSRK